MTSKSSILWTWTLYIYTITSKYLKENEEKYFKEFEENDEELLEFDLIDHTFLKELFLYRPEKYIGAIKQGIFIF